jgi:hypothetical protein
VLDIRVPASVLRLVDRLADVPVLVTTVAREIVVANAMATALFSELTSGGRRERTLAWRRFMGLPSIRVMGSPEELAEDEEILVAELQVASARFPADPFLAAMIADLRSQSLRFEDLWTDRRLRLGHAKQKHFAHPEVGELTLDCDDLMIQGSDLDLVVFSACPGSSSAEALTLLGVIGLQHFDAPTDQNSVSPPGD